MLKSGLGLANTAARYGAVEDCWPPPTPPSPMLLDQEMVDEGEINKLDLNLAQKFFANMHPNTHL